MKKQTRPIAALSQRSDPYAGTKAKNHEGFPTFIRSDQEAYLQVLLTNTLSGTFYADQKELLADSLALHELMAQQNPDFMARAILYARNFGFMRLQPIVGLAFLAKHNLSLFRQIFSRVIQTPGDLSDFVEIMRGKVVSNGMGRAVKTTINEWLAGLSEYHAIKYGSGGQGYSLRDILRLCHPKPKDMKRQLVFNYLVSGELQFAPESTGDIPGPAWYDAGSNVPQIEAFERLKQVASSASEYASDADMQAAARQYIAAGRLPHEAVTGVLKPDVETWKALIDQMPYLALLRHLVTFQRQGVLKDQEAVAKIADRLRNLVAMTRAKVLPFRFYSAMQEFHPQTSAEGDIYSALSDALESSFVNLPELPGRICIAPDVSGSMHGLIYDKSSIHYCDVTGILAGALLKKCANTPLVLPFETSVKRQTRFNKNDSIMTTANYIAGMTGGGTHVGAPIEWLYNNKDRVDTIIAITDSEDWAGGGFLPAWRRYRQDINRDAQAFLVTISPYRVAVAPQDEPGIHYIYGWNDSVLSFISQKAAGSQVAAVNAIALDTVPELAVAAELES